MSHFAAAPVIAEHAQCLVCEKTITNNAWFARVKHGDWTVVLCSERCANAFYAQQLPASDASYFRQHIRRSIGRELAPAQKNLRTNPPLALLILRD